MKIRITPDPLTADTYRDLLDRIPTGHRQAVAMKALANEYDMRTDEIRAYVLSARIDGVLILSGQPGFYLPGNIDELKDYVTRRKQYLRTAELALIPFVHELKRIEGGNIP